MKVLIAVVVLVAAVALIWVFGMSYSLEVGNSPTNPLGEPTKVDKALTGLGLRKTDPEKGEVKSLLGDRMQITEDLNSASYVDGVPGLRHQVIVVKKPDGKIGGVVSHFRSGALEFSKTGTKAENFAALYWIKLTGAEPKFTKQSEGGADGREYLLAKVSRGGFDAQWKKEGGGATLSVPHEIADTVTFVAK